MDTLFGLPAHPLLVHLAVIAVPVAAVLVAVVAVFPRLPNLAKASAVALSALSVALMPMMESSGTTLARRLPPTALVERHTELGESLLGWVVGLFVVVLAIVAVDSWARRARKTAGPGAQRELGSGARGGVIRHSLALLAIVIAAATIVQTVRVGHSGAQATWSPPAVSAPAGTKSGDEH